MGNLKRMENIEKKIESCEDSVKALYESIEELSIRPHIISTTREEVMNFHESIAYNLRHKIEMYKHIQDLYNEIDDLKDEIKVQGELDGM